MSSDLILLNDLNESVTLKRNLKSSLALKFAKQLQANEMDEDKSGSKKPKTNSTSANPSATHPPLVKEIMHYADQGHLPIILVPSASSKSKINILNVQKFLSQGIYEEPNTKTMTRPEKLPLIIDHQLSGKPMKFRIFDDTRSFRKFEWKCLVGIVCDGKKWQFSGFPFKSEADLFASIKGFYCKFEDEPVQEPVSTWNVQILNLSRTTRHGDSGKKDEFWKNIDNWLLVGGKLRKFSNEHKL
jgi:RNA pol II accessory factor, Cdc73 family, C-terminal